MIKLLEKELKEVVPLDAYKPRRNRTYVLITPINFKIERFLEILKYKEAVLVGVMDQNRDFRFLMGELDRVGLKVHDVFKEIKILNPKVEWENFDKISLIAKVEKEYNLLPPETRFNVRLLFDIITFGVYTENYRIKKRWIKGNLDFGPFAEIIEDEIVPKIEKLYAIFNEDWDKSRILGTIKVFSDDPEPFYLFAKKLLEKIRYQMIVKDEIRETLEISLSWGINLAKDGESFKDIFLNLMLYRMEFVGFGENAKLGVEEAEYFLENFKGRIDLETELRIKNILGNFYIFLGNFNQAEYIFKEIMGRHEGMLKDMAVLNLGLLENMKGNIRKAYEIYKSLIENSKYKNVLSAALVNVLALYTRPNYNEKIDLIEIERLVKSGLKLMEELRDYRDIYKIKYNFAIVLANMGEYDKAIKQVEDIIKISKDRNKNEYADAMGLLGYILTLRGDYEKALSTFELSLETFDLRYREFEWRYYISKIHYALALAKAGRLEESLKIMQEVRGKAEELGIKDTWESVMKNLNL